MTSKALLEIPIIVKLIDAGGIGIDDDNTARAWGLLENGLRVTHQNIAEYQRKVKQLHRDLCISDYSFSHFEKLFLLAFKSNVASKSDPTKKEIADFRESLSSEPTKDFLVTRDLYGVAADPPPDDPLTFGPFQVFFFEKHKELLIGQGKTEPSLLWHNRNPIYLIGVRVEAKHKDRAIEKADELFDKFEKVGKFMIGPDDRYDIKIINPFGRHATNAYVFSSESFSSGSFSWHGPFEAVPIDSPYFNDSSLGYDKLWSFLEKTGNNLHSKIAMAAQWLGQSYAEKSNSASFIKAAISLEVLFTANEKSVINPSILNQIAEAVACLLGESASSRINIEKQLKKFYAIRSAVAHAGKLDVSQEDLREFQYIARQALMRILKSPHLLSFSSIESLYDHLKQLKYSFKEI